MNGEWSNDKWMLDPGLVDTLQKDSIALRKPENRLVVDDLYFRRLFILIRSPLSDVVLISALKVVANAVADCDVNRDRLTEEDLCVLIKTLKETSEAINATLILTVLHNFANDNERASSMLRAHTEIPSIITACLAKFGDFVSMSIVHDHIERYLEEVDCIPLSIVPPLVRIAEDECNDCDDSKDATALLMRLAGSSEKFEEEFTSVERFQHLLLIACHTFEDPEIRQHTLSALGNISARKSFNVTISRDSKLVMQIISLTHDKQPLAACTAMCILGNLATTTEQVTELLKLAPKLPETVSTLLLATTNPFELQAAHLLRNLGMLESVRESVTKIDEIIVKMLDIQILPQIRSLAVLLASTYLSNSISKLLIARIQKEDDPSVTNAIIKLTPTILDRCLADFNDEETLNSCLNAIFESLEMGDTSRDKWDVALMIRLTRALGVAAVQIPNELLTRNIRSLLDLPKNLDSTDSLHFALAKNIAFIAAKVKDATDDGELQKSCDVAISRVI